MKVWVYRSRNGNHGVFTGDHAGYTRAVKRMEDDNGMTIVEAIAQEDFEVGGGYDEGHFYIDDGGSIELFEVK